MKNIIYFNPSDAAKFDFERYANSLKRYADISDKDIKAALKCVNEYENLHVSRLVELGTALIEKFGSEAKAKQYFEAVEGKKIIPPKAYIKADNLLRKFIIAEGFDIEWPGMKK